MTGFVSLHPMTAEMYHAYYREYQNDPDLFIDKSKYNPFTYSPEWVDSYIQRQISRNRKCFAIMVGEEMAGEVILKSIEPGKCATLGICMKNDQYKNRGFGTQAERLAIDYVFHELDIPVLYADSILTNERSQHVLKKAGFQEIGRDETFVYYKISQSDVRAEISIKKADKKDLKKIHDMQLTAFRPLLDKYEDYETSPAAEPFERTLQRFSFDNVSYHLITLGTEVIGAVRVRWNNDIYVLAQILIMPEYQGLGYAQKAIRLVEAMYPNASLWRLDTIAQEAKLCHLYEKLGYHKTGKMEHIKDGMDIIFYEKVMNA